MSFTRWLYLSVFFLLCSFGLQGQEALGIVNGNYSGSRGIKINPSSIANSRLRVDYGLFTIHSFAENNYFYLPANEASFFKIINGSYRFPFFAKPFGEGERNVPSYYMDKSDKNIFSNTSIDGPSVMFGLNDHMFALHSSFRIVSSTYDVPYDIANFSYYTMDFYPQHNIYYEDQSFGMASMAWWEIGVSYATILARPFRTLWSAGITVNWIGGYSAAYVTGNEANYVAYNDSILNVDYLDGELGYSMPMNYQTDDFDFFGKMVRGSGLGVDLGVTFQYREKPYMRKYKGKYYRKKFEDYLYKVGFSILDIGYANFRNNAEKHAYDGVSNHHINVDYLDYTNFADEIRSTSYLLYGDSSASYRDNRFKIYLPTALSLQFDYNPSGPWYVNATIVAPLKLYTPMIKRPTILALTPRYETERFEVSLPIVLYDYLYPRLGFSVRVFGLTMGTDNLGGFLGYRDFTGYDFYISYKINLNGTKRPFHSRRNPCWYN